MYEYFFFITQSECVLGVNAHPKKGMYEGFQFDDQIEVGISRYDGNNQINYQCFTFLIQLDGYLVEYNCKLSQIECSTDHVFRLILDHSSQSDVNENDDNNFKNKSIMVDCNGCSMVSCWVIHDNFFSLSMVQIVENKVFEKGKYQF